jgi:serine/threonine protein kinase
MNLVSGQCLGAYEIIAPLGAGGRGEVFRARDTSLGREVAIKMLPTEKVGPEQLARFMAEARAATRQNHPNIIAIDDWIRRRRAPRPAASQSGGVFLGGCCHFDPANLEWPRVSGVTF